MKKNTRMLALLFAICLSVVGCGGTKDKDLANDVVVDEQNDSVLSEQTEGDTQTVTDDLVENEATSGKVGIEGRELFSTNGLTVTLKDVVLEEIWTKGIDVTIENASDMELKISCERIAINDYMFIASMRETLAAGETIDGNIYLYEDQFDAPQGDEIGQVSLYFEVIDRSKYEVIYDSEEILLKTSNYDNVQIVKADEGNEIYNSNNIRIVSQEMVFDSENGNKLFLFIENNSDEPIAVDCSSSVVNGYDIENLCYYYVYPGKMVSGYILFYSTMDSYGITEIEDLQVSFVIKNKNSLATIDQTDKISVQVN